MGCPQCIATTSKGIRCKNNTCKYFEYCRTHTFYILGLTLKPSSIPGAGTGLFTTRSFKKGEHIANYTGELKPHSNSGYAVHIKKGLVLDAVSPNTAIGRYANTCKKNDDCKGNNAKLVVNTKAKTVRLVATKGIKKHSEVFVPYGRRYWK